MNLINKFNIPENEILKSSNYIRFCDDVFAASLPLKEFKKYFKLSEVYVINDDDENILFIKKNLKVKNGSVIFCNTDFVDLFFNFLNKNKNLQSLRLLTCQSDQKINRNLYRKKPDIITDWFTVNTKLNKKNLTPFPFGIANAKYDKNVTYEDIFNFKESKQNRLEKLYINFNLNTNYFHRFKAKKNLSKSKLSEIEIDLSFKKYLDSIHNYKFILCPWGNGYDTHRFWEVIYSGGIPVTKKNNSYEKFNQFPIILLNKYDVLEFEEAIKNYTQPSLDEEILKTSWWFKNVIKNIKIDTEKNVLLELEQDIFENYKKYYSKKIQKQKIIKNFKTTLRKIHQKMYSM